MMMGSRSIGFVLIGAMGVAAGMYLSTAMNHRTERQMRRQGRRLLRSAAGNAAKIGAMYETSRQRLGDRVYARRP